jgi:Uma2 family endonuclease
VNVSAAGPAAGHHPAWLRAFWHYDPDYAYALETYEYGYSTTDPCYIEDGVRLSSNAYHDEFLTAAKANLLRFLKLTGQDLSVTREVPVRNLPDLPLARQSRRRLEPDLGVWPTGTQVRRESMLQWEEVGLLRLVVECLSQSTTHNDLVTKPDLYRDLGVEEYWVCRAHPMQVHTVYQRDDQGRWQERLVPSEQGLYSPVLGTRVRIHEEDGFQCQDPATGRWIEADASFYDEGYSEGYYRERRKSLLDLAEVLCTAQELADLKSELEAADPQTWPSIKDLYGRYRPRGEGAP